MNTANLIEALSRKRVTGVSFKNNIIKLKFDGRILTNKVVVRSHIAWTGSFDRVRPIVYVDNDVPKKYRLPLAIHETVEKYLSEMYNLDPNAEAHEIAEEVERRWFLKRYSQKEWEEYSKIVERIHRKEMEFKFSLY